MTVMPDVIGKTEIFTKVDKLLNSASPAKLEKWLIYLSERPIRELLDDLIKAEELVLPRYMVDHIQKHALAPPAAGGWWEAEVEATATEGFAWAIQRMLCTSKGTRRKKTKKIDCWWICPSTYAFRFIVCESRQQITAMILTPPKGDHPEHYARYKETLANRPTPELLKVPPNYDHEESMLVISAERDAVFKGQNGKKVGRKLEPEEHLTQAQKVAVVNPLCERHESS